jgi:hypothetical protein
MTGTLLGSRRAVGVADTTGNNTGNWTVTFDPATLNVNVGQFEINKVVIRTQSAAFIIQFSVYVDSNQWDANFVPGGNVLGSNTWDPANPIKLRPGQYLYFYFDEPDSDGTPPTVTIWLQFDETLRINEGYSGK